MLTAAAFVMGQVTSKPVREALADAQEPIQVFAAVEQRVVDSRSAYPATIDLGDIVNVEPASADGAVVVRQVLKPEGTVGPGALLAVISGIPYFALPAPLPLYRDFSWSDSGDDVVLLQRALNASGFDAGTSGFVDWRTFQALSALYKQNGVVFRCCTSIQHESLVPIEALPAHVVGVATVGSTISDSNPIAELRVGGAFVRFTVDATVASDLELGQELVANIDGTSVPLTLESIGEFVAPSASAPGGREIRLRPRAELSQGLDAGQNVTVFGPGSSEESLAVPLVGVRQDNAGTFVQRRVLNAGQESLERVAVSVVRLGGGWAAIAEGELAAGDEVLVS